MKEKLQKLHVLAISARDLKTNEVKKNTFVFDNPVTIKTFAVLVKLVIHPPHKYDVTIEATETDLVTTDRVADLLEMSQKIADKINLATVDTE